MTKNNWQPIETAPRDGTRILAWIPCDDEKHEIMWMDVSINGWDRWHYAGGWIPAFCQQPTHWQPLPGPPKEGE